MINLQRTTPQNKWFYSMALALVVATALPAQAQQSDPQGDPQQGDPQLQQPRQPNPGWRRFGDPSRGPDQTQQQYPQQQNQQQYPQDQRGNWNQQDQQNYPPPPPPPPSLTLPAGAWLNIRIDEPLASNRNQPGDTFTGTLTQPVVADGRVIARRGQMIVGRVTESTTGSRAGGTSRLGLEVTEVSLVDGQQIHLKTQMIQRRGAGSGGENVATVGATTGIGAAIGAAAAGPMGAGLGAIAGAGASVIGVLVSHGKPAVVYPETILTFRTEQPAMVSTERAAQAFEQVRPEDYEHAPSLRQQGPPPRPAGYYYPRPAYYGGFYPSPYYYGPSLFIGSGFYYGRGFRRW